MIPAASTLAPARSESSRLTIFGIERNGQPAAENSAQSLCEGGSDEIRLIPHIGPTTKAKRVPSGWPQTQQSFFSTASVHLRPSIARNSGLPSRQATNQGTG